MVAADYAHTLEAQGRLVKLSKRQGERADATPTAKRGKVTGFSRKSRKRVLDLFARMDFDATRVTFLTLTFRNHISFSDAWQVMRRFLMRLTRKHPGCACVWKKELQQRGTIHYHMIAFGMPYYPQDALQRVWTDCTNEDLSIVDVRLVRSAKQLISYVGKYVAKVQMYDAATSLDIQPYLHADGSDSTGRWWGIHNRDALPYATHYQIPLDNGEAIKYLDFGMRALSDGHAVIGKNGGTLYHDDAYAVLYHAYYLNRAMHNRPGFEILKWSYIKHGTCTMLALSEIVVASRSGGESPKSLAQALCQVTYGMPTATPRQRIAAARQLLDT
jgi:hypothetical protein